MKCLILIWFLLVVFLVGCSDKDEIIGKCLSDIEVQSAADAFANVKLDSYSNDSLRLIFRIPKLSCSSCINREMSIMKGFVKKKQIPLIITSFDSNRDVLVFAKTHNVELKNICNKKGRLFNEFDEVNPYYLVSSKSMIVESVCVVTKRNKNQSKHFLASRISVDNTGVFFTTSSFSFGTIPQGHPKTVAFAFKNTGKAPLVIYNAEASCGCTQPEYPKEPIAPGNKGEIKVTYDAKEPGRFVKTITVYHNGGSGMDVLEIRGTVNSEQ